MKSLTALLLAFTTTTAFAQEDKKMTISPQIAKNTILSRTVQSSINSGFISTNSFTRLIASNNGTKAEANIEYSLKKVELALNISTPVSSAEQTVKPLTLSGLSNKSALTIGLQKIFWGEAANFSLDASKSLMPADKNYIPNSDTKILSPEQFEFLQNAKFEWSTAFYLGGKASIQKQDFNYLSDTVTFIQTQDTKNSYELSLTGGVLTDWGSFALTFTNSNGYSGKKASKYYFPVNGSNVQIEKELSLGAPAHQTEQKIRVEYLSLGNAGASARRIRINPNINFALQEELFSIELPVYFLSAPQKANKAGFTGGLFISYVSDEEYNVIFAKSNIGFGLFIGGSLNDIFAPKKD